MRFSRLLFQLSIWLFSGAVIFSIVGCDKLTVIKSLEGEHYKLVDQDSLEANFPESYTGQVMLVGYVYTHCPDICPLITYNMRDIQQSLADEDNFILVSLSFDPERDSPQVLKNYARNYRLDQSNWRLLTGDPNVVQDLLDKLEISTLKTPTRFINEDEAVYFIDHTDRVSLIDKNGNIRKQYIGSGLDSEQVINDILILLNE